MALWEPLSTPIRINNAGFTETTLEPGGVSRATKRWSVKWALIMVHSIGLSIASWAIMIREQLEEVSKFSPKTAATATL